MAGFFDSIVKDFKAYLDETLKVPVYYEGSVPQTAGLPYAVFSIQFLEVGRALATLNLYYKDTGLKNAMDVVDMLVSDVKYSKRFGSLVIDEGSPVAQIVPSDELDLKHVYMTFSIRHLVDARYL